MKVHVSRTEEEHLNSIGEKVTSKTAFNKYLSKTPDETPGVADTNDDKSTGSSGEGDDSETDPNYSKRC